MRSLFFYLSITHWKKKHWLYGCLKTEFPLSLIRLFQIVASNGSDILIEHISYGLTIIKSCATLIWKWNLFAFYQVTNYFVDVSENIAFCWNLMLDFFVVILAFLLATTLLTIFLAIFNSGRNFECFLDFLNLLFTVACWSFFLKRGTLCQRETIVSIVV